MGYTTDFEGQFDFNKELDDETYNLLQGLATTRRMARDIEGFGTQGEFYIEDDDKGVTEHNKPPSTQPSLWLQWIPTEDRLHLEWDGCEKFYHYVEWLEYLITAVLAPKGYVLNGSVYYRGEDFSDMGTITIEDNEVTQHFGTIVEYKPKAEPKKGKLQIAIIGTDIDREKYCKEYLTPLAIVNNCKLDKAQLSNGVAELIGLIDVLKGLVPEISRTNITNSQGMVVCTVTCSNITEIN